LNWYETNDERHSFHILSVALLILPRYINYENFSVGSMKKLHELLVLLYYERKLVETLSAGIIVKVCRVLNVDVCDLIHGHGPENVRRQYTLAQLWPNYK
jgi:hypothetical protein